MKVFKYAMFVFTCVQPFLWWVIYDIFRPRAVTNGTNDFLQVACIFSGLAATLCGLIITTNLSTANDKKDKEETDFSNQ